MRFGIFQQKQLFFHQMMVPPIMPCDLSGLSDPGYIADPEDMVGIQRIRWGSKGYGGDPKDTVGRAVRAIRGYRDTRSAFSPLGLSVHVILIYALNELKNGPGK